MVNQHERVGSNTLRRAGQGAGGELPGYVTTNLKVLTHDSQVK
jgi:hypothetical protein